MKSSIVLIFNPIAQKASNKKITRAFQFLKSRGYNVELLFTEKKGDAENFAKETAKDSPSLVIAAGGDGTFNEVINGLAGSDVPMAILPLGTTNVLAKELKIPENVNDALEIALKGSLQSVSLGKIAVTHNPSPITRYFVLMAGIGFDGEAVHGVNDVFKRISGKGAYIISGIKTLSRFHPAELTFHIGGETYCGYTAIVGKAAKYGGNYRITPDARLTDPSLYICIFKGKNRSDFLRYAIGIMTEKHLKFKDVAYIKASSIEVTGSAHVQIDGDYFGKTPARIEVAPDVINLVF